ncbi:hypothetical protein INT43_000582 [Umbelopsis isabellina]|uniref:Transmembrane protein UsgS n=1 Tax=Mortierella isabellina TaxID=91625 RepID=A0A8H7Q422_MORIS|nr:hypothetical protein INT43_000582 [Umbelopsis isabellina]
MPWRPEAVLHGVQYAIEGCLVVGQNPQLRKERYLQVFGYLLIASISLYALSKVLILFPLQIVRFIAFLISVLGRYDNSKVDAFLISVSRYIRDGLVSLPFVGLLFMRYLYPKPIDQLFMESLRYVDTQSPKQPYAPALAGRSFRIDYWANLRQYLWRSFKKARIGIVVYLLSLMPLIGRFILPAAGAYTVYRSLGRNQAIVVGVCFLLLPQPITKTIMRALFEMRALMRELLEPYFERVALNSKQRRKWFKRREDILLGYSAVAYALSRIPFLGVIGYGVAQAASSYLLVQLDDPPTLDMSVTELIDGKYKKSSKPATTAEETQHKDL